jgi:uncharacterized membrane protein
MNLFHSWKQKVTDYIDVRIGLVRLGLIERTSLLLGNLMVAFLYFFLGLALMIFLGFAILEIFIEIFKSRVIGACLTACLYALLMGLLFIFRKRLILAFASLFIRVLTEGHDNEEDEEEIEARYKRLKHKELR